VSAADGQGWRKSSRSSIANGCVEVRDFRKSTYSSYNGNCAEAASAGGTVLVRDTRDRGGVTLAFSASAWREFTAAVKQ